MSTQQKSVFRRAFNRIVHIIVRFSFGATSCRPFFHRLRGVKIHGKVWIGDDVYIENEYPEYVEIHEGARITQRTIIMAHFHGAGKVVIGKNVWIGPNCVITANPGTTLTLGEGSVIAASSVVTKDIAPYTFVGGAPAKPIAKITLPFMPETSYEEWKKGLRPIKEDD